MLIITAIAIIVTYSGLHLLDTVTEYLYQYLLPIITILVTYSIVHQCFLKMVIVVGLGGVITREYSS